MCVTIDRIAFCEPRGNNEWICFARRRVGISLTVVSWVAVAVTHIEKQTGVTGRPLF
jgi:hypothetical protein